MTVKAATRSLINASSTTLEDGNAIHDGPDGDVVKVVWAACANGDSGSPISLIQFSDRSVQVAGTLGAGGTMVIEGSNDGTTYYTLNDTFGNPLSITALGLKGIAEIAAYIRPRVSAGDGTTSLVATLICRR